MLHNDIVLCCQIVSKKVVCHIVNGNILCLREKLNYFGNGKRAFNFPAFYS